WNDDGALLYCPAWGAAIQRQFAGQSSAQGCSAIDARSNEISHINPTAVGQSRWMLYNVWSGGETTDIHAVDLQSMSKHAVVANGNSPRVAATPRGDYLLFER